MGDFQQKDGEGALFKNDKRETEMHPHYTGTITVGGVQYWLSAWLKDAKSGKKYMSLSAAPKKARADVPVKLPAGVPPQPEISDDIPFAWAAIIPLGGMLAYAASNVQTLL